MSSSTSNSKKEWRVVAFVLAVLLITEGVGRFLEQRASHDIRHLREIPKISERIGLQEGTRILFIGNSLVREGIDVAILDAALRKDGMEGPAISKIMPDASSVIEWYYVYDAFFVDEGRHPDVLVLGYAAKHLRDREHINPINASNLARYFCGWNIDDVFRRDVTTFEDRAEYCLSAASAAFAIRARLGRRVLSNVIPYYSTTAQELNRGMIRDEDELAADDDTTVEPTYERVQELFRLAKGQGVHVFVLAIPLPKVYKIDQGLQDAMRDYGVTLIDARTLEGIDENRFSDGYHLDEDGAAILSRFVAKRLVEAQADWAPSLRDSSAAP